MSVKISIIARNAEGWHAQQLKRAAAQRGVDCEITALSAHKSLGEQIDTLGDVVIWRSSWLDHLSERASVKPLGRGRQWINEAMITQPMIAYKYFQQSTLESVPYMRKHGIPTFRAKTLAMVQSLLDKDQLRFPFIAKPNLGSRGENVELIKNLEDLTSWAAAVELKSYIFQNFIPNDGDWRVIVLGGRPLGVIKRTATTDSHRNNVSQGASSALEPDAGVAAVVSELAVKAASVFGLRFTGVDVIQDKTTGQFMILEVNTAPQWNGEQGFEAITGVAVAEKVIDYAIDLHQSQAAVTPSMVEAYYKKTIEYNFAGQFHFASRLWLWKGDAWARKVLDNAQQRYIGLTPEEIRTKIDDMIAAHQTRRPSESKPYRRPYLEKYPQLMLYNALLFKVMFCDSIYGLDIRPYIRTRIDDATFMRLFNDLVGDADAVRVLSTHAVNYFYNLRWYFRGSVTKTILAKVDPYEILTQAENYDDLIARGELTREDALKLKIYVLTHAIIGGSRFYQRTAKLRAYKAMMTQLEEIIRENYGDISLDNKCEFLVCAQLTGHETSLKPIILDEAQRSRSWAGPFIIDTLNRRAGKAVDGIRTAEHRNVLYVMATTPYQGVTKRPTATVVKSHPRTKQSIGRLAQVSIPEFGIRRVIARVDTGATSSSIHCKSIHETEKGLSFTLFDPEHILWTGKEVTATDYQKVKVKNPSGGVQERYTVNTTVICGGVSKVITFSLSDRGAMIYSVLLGRNFIKQDFVVDIDYQFAMRRYK